MFFAQILLNSLVLGTQVLLLALSLYLIYAVSKTFHIALGAIGTTTAYALYFAITHQYPLLITILLVIIVAIVLGVISYYLLEPFIRKQEDTLALLASFSLLVILESCIPIVFGSDGKSFIQGVLPTLQVGGLYVTLPGIATLGLGFLVALITLIIVIKTPWGRILRSIAENVNLVTSLTVNASTIRFVTFILASFLASFIVILSSLNTALTPRGSFDILIMAFVALIIGGIKDIKGTIIASFIITLVPELIIGLSSADLHLSASWKMFFVFILAVILLTWKPEGLLAVKQRND